MIDWNASDWQAVGSLAQAVSGLIVGIAAVFGAVKVGMRQVTIITRQADIAERQNEILDQQRALEDRRLANELYDRRYKTFDATALFLIQAINTADFKPTVETENKFYLAIGESRFLFREEMHESLLTIYKKVHDLYAARATTERFNKKAGYYREEDTEREGRLQDWANDQINDLHNLFPELKLA